MSEETIKEIFLEIAFRAMETGKEIKLEKGKNTSWSETLSGVLARSNTNYDSLIMNVFQPAETEIVIEDDEEDGEP